VTYEPSDLAKRIQQCTATFEERKMEYEKAAAAHAQSALILDKALEKKDQALLMLKAELKKIDETFR
jgi:hypothetical protein